MIISVHQVYLSTLFSKNYDNFRSPSIFVYIVFEKLTLLVVNFSVLTDKKNNLSLWFDFVSTLSTSKINS